MREIEKAPSVDGVEGEARNSILAVALTAHCLSKAQADRGNELEKPPCARDAGGKDASPTQPPTR